MLVACVWCNPHISTTESTRISSGRSGCREILLFTCRRSPWQKDISACSRTVSAELQVSSVTIFNCWYNFLIYILASKMRATSNILKLEFSFHFTSWDRHFHHLILKIYYYFLDSAIFHTDNFQIERHNILI